MASKAIEQAIAMKKARAVWTLVAKAKYSSTGGGDGRAGPQRNCWQEATRSDAETSREKLLQRTHELRRERARDHQHGFALAGQFVGEGKETHRRGRVLQRNFHARVWEGLIGGLQTPRRPPRDASSATTPRRQQDRRMAKSPGCPREL